MAEDSEFQHELIQYLEDVMSGEFDGETMLTMKDNVDNLSNTDSTKMVPTPPGTACTCSGSCASEQCYERWKEHFCAVTNEILYRSN